LKECFCYEKKLNLIKAYFSVKKVYILKKVK